MALGLALVADGDYSEAVLGGVNYGRDSDSIATMAGAITGALGGLGAVPKDWVDEVAVASRIDLAGPGRDDGRRGARHRAATPSGRAAPAQPTALEVCDDRCARLTWVAA